MEVIKLPKKFRMVCYEIMDGKEEALDTLESFADKYPHQVAAVKAEVAYFNLDYEKALALDLTILPWLEEWYYSYYYLDQEGRALRYFEKALEARPDDEDTMQLIDGCKKGISLPQFSECFRERTEDWWETFAEMEAELRQMMDNDKDHTRGAELVAQMEETLNLIFDEISFEMGFNGEKYELILTP